MSGMLKLPRVANPPSDGAEESKSSPRVVENLHQMRRRDGELRATDPDGFVIGSTMSATGRRALALRVYLRKIEFDHLEEDLVKNTVDRVSYLPGDQHASRTCAPSERVVGPLAVAALAPPSRLSRALHGTRQAERIAAALAVAVARGAPT